MGNVLSYNSGSQKSKIKVSTELCYASSETLGRTLPWLFLASGDGLLATFGTPWLTDTSLQFSVSTRHAFCVSVPSHGIPSDTSHVGSEAHPTLV